MSAQSHTASLNSSSADSTQPVFYDRWNQRRLQRHETEQDFRKERGGSAHSDFSHATSSPAPLLQHASDSHQLHQPQQQQQTTNYSTRVSPANASSAPLPVSASSPSAEVPLAHAFSHYQDSQAHSPSDNQPQFHSSSPRAHLQPSRSFTRGNALEEMTSMSNGASSPGKLKVATNSRQMHSTMNLGGQLAQSQTMPSFTATAPQTQQARNAQAQQPGAGEVGRATPQLPNVAEDMSVEDVNQLIKDHKELRESAPHKMDTTSSASADLSSSCRRKVHQGQEVLF